MKDCNIIKFFFYNINSNIPVFLTKRFFIVLCCMRICFCLYLLLFLVSCKHADKNQQIIIEGHVKNVPDGKLYLAHARQWKTPIDSTTITNGHFIFKREINTSATPFLADIHYVDSQKIKRFLFSNFTLGKDSNQFFKDVFYWEPIHIKIEGDNSKLPYLRIFAGKETTLLFQNQFTDFGWIDNLNATDKTKKIAEFSKKILQNPGSFFYLQSIYDSREQYTKNQLEILFSLFAKNIRQSDVGKKFQTYLSIRPDDNAPLPNLVLTTPSGEKQNIIDTTATVNMLIFWASWCIPCRKEIPELKKLAASNKNRSFKMISISIDEHEENWRNALQVDKPGWTQVHLPYNQLEKIQDQFRFTSIPLVIFTNQYGNELKRFAGYKTNNLQLYQQLLDKSLH